MRSRFHFLNQKMRMWYLDNYKEYHEIFLRVLKC